MICMDRGDDIIQAHVVAEMQSARRGPGEAFDVDAFQSGVGQQHFIRSGEMNFSKSCVPLGMCPSALAEVIIISFDQPVALGVDKISSPPGASRVANAFRNAAGSATCSITSIRGDEIELSLELVHVADAIVDLETLPPRVIARNRDHFGRSVDAGDFGAETRQRLGQQACPAADVERRLALQRRAAALVALPMLVDLSRTYLSRTGLSLCSIAEAPSGSHQSPAELCRTAQPLRAAMLVCAMRAPLTGRARSPKERECPAS